MSTDTQTSPKQDSIKKELSLPQKAWLGQVIGGKDFFGDETGIAPLDVKGNVLDLAELEKEVNEAKKLAKENEEPISPELEEKINQLKRFGIPDLASEFTKQSEAREKALTEVRNLIEMEKEAIRKASREGVAKKSGMSFLKKPGPTPEQLKAINSVIEQITLFTDRLKSNEDVEFSPQDLMNEIWTPLVREGLITEAQCPDQFSRVIQLFKGASALYNKRLEAFTRKKQEEDDKLADARDVVDDISDVLGIGAGVVDLVLGLVGGHGNVQEIIKLATKCAQGSLKTSSALMEKKADYEAAGGQIADILGSVLEAAIGGKNGKSIGKIAKGAFSGCVSLGLFAKKISERDYVDGLDLLADAVSSALSCVSDGIADSNEGASKKIGEAAKHVGDGLKGLFHGGKLIYLMSQNPVDMKSVNGEIRKLTLISLKKALTATVDNAIQKPELEDMKKDKEQALQGLEEGSKDYKKVEKEWDDKIEKLEDAQSEDLDALGNILGDAFEGGESAMAGIESKVEQLALMKGAEASNELIRLDNEKFNKQLGIAFGLSLGGEEGDAAMLEELYSIDSLILQIERDNATLQMFNLIFDAVGGVVATLIPQLGGPLKAKAMAMNVASAVGRTTDLLQFSALLSDAKKASSPQGPALLAQIDELKRHLTNDLIEASIAFGQAVSLSVAAAGDLAIGAMGTGAVAGVAGRAVNSGLELLKETKELLKKWFEQRKTARAWELYRNALDNPTDREAIIASFRKNPTLAKYSLAYGALEMDDPIARETLRQVGLNDAVLGQENASAEKVVMYLEAKFSDDLKVEGIVSSFVPITGDPLTISVWVSNKTNAKDPKNPEQWKEEKTNAIDAAIIKANKLSSEEKKHDISKVNKLDQWEMALQKANEYILSLEELKTSFSDFKPKTMSGGAFERFQDYLNQLIAFADLQIEEVKKKIEIATISQASTKNLLKATIDAATRSIEELNKGKTEIGPPPSPEQSKIAELLSAGAIGKLTTKLADLTLSTPKLQLHVESFAHSVTSASRKVARERDPGRLTSILQELSKEVGVCVASLELELSLATTDFDKLNAINKK